MKAMKIKALYASVLTSALLAQGALACTTDAWSSASGGTLADSPAAVARVSGLCGLQVTGTGHVQDTTPVAEGRYIARFYFKPGSNGAGDDTIFAAYSDDGATTELFSVSYNNGTVNFNGNTTGSVAALADKWNLIELDYTDGGNLAYWVNKDATTEPADGSVAGGSGTVESVRLGHPNGTTDGPGLFDDFESHRSTAVGPLLMGDVNGDDIVNIFDAIGVLKESGGFELQNGLPDCNYDGIVNIFDAIGVLKAGLPGGSAVPCSNGVL